MSESPWPPLDYASLAPTVGYLNRIVQVAGKYTLDALFEPGWGNIVFDVSPRGLSTPTLHPQGLTFRVHYRLLDDDVVIETDRGEATVPLGAGSVAAFCRAFTVAAHGLGLGGPGSPLLCEIPGAAPTFELDVESRPCDPAAARSVWRGFSLVAAALEDWQAPFRGHRPRVGVMWGGFDLSATRYRGVKVVPPSDRPSFLLHGMTEEYLAVGLSFGNSEMPEVSLYAYMAPEPAGMGEWPWAAAGATWDARSGLVLLGWEALRQEPDPAGTVVAFGDAVYAAAQGLAGWPGDLVGPRFDGWYASRTPPGRLGQP